MKFVQLANSLKEGLAPVYVIEGEEAFFRDHAVKSIRAACALAQPTLNDIRMEGEAVKGGLSAFRDNLYALPFFDEKRLVRVYEFYPTEKEWEFLKSYMEKPCPSTVLLIVNGGKKANAADLKKKKEVVYVDCSRESEEMLTRWLFNLMRKEGLSIDSDTVALMVRYCNSDAARMRLETLKLKLIAGDNKITRAMVEEYVAKDVEYKIYELTQAASTRNANAFWDILNDLTEKGFDENSVLAALTSHFKTLSEIAETRGTDAEASKALGVHQYVVKKNREVLARLLKGRAQEIYLRLYALSSGMKSGGYTKTGALYSAIANIFFS